MAYQTPPTFTTGDVLSATQLNILSDDIEYLNGFAVSASPAMVSVHLDQDGDAFFMIRHTQRYLHFKYRGQDRIRVYYDTTEVYSVDDTVGDQTVAVDLNPFGLTLGQLYVLKINIASTNDPLYVYYAYEAAS